MPATLDLTLAADTRPTIYPARMHGAACAILGHPAQGERPRFSVTPPVGRGRTIDWRLGWLGAEPCRRDIHDVIFGDTSHRVLDLRVREWRHAELARGPVTRRARIEVLSPMYFSRGDRDHPAPDAVLATRSLLDRWDFHAPSVLASSASERASLLATVYLSDMDGRTERGPVGKITQQTGFVGTMTLALTRKADQGTAELFSTLIRFAEIAGIGAQTGHGFGAVRTGIGLPDRDSYRSTS